MAKGIINYNNATQAKAIESLKRFEEGVKQGTIVEASYGGFIANILMDLDIEIVND